MRLHTKLLLSFGLALTAVVAMQVWVGSVMIGALPPGDHRLLLALVSVQAAVAVVAMVVVLIAVRRLVVRPLRGGPSLSGRRRARPRSRGCWTSPTWS